MSTSITLPAVFDVHLHLRQTRHWHLNVEKPCKRVYVDLNKIAPYTAQQCDRAIIMPNTDPPITDKRLVDLYRADCEKALGSNTQALMTAKLTLQTRPEDVRLLAGHIIGFKLYPSGVTTNSSDGIPALELHKPSQNFADVLTEIEKFATPAKQLTLLMHAEMPGEFCMDREMAFLHTFLPTIHAYWPKLRVTVEHITTRYGLDCVRRYAALGQPIAGTITAHHPLLTLDDVIGDGINPDLYCKPIANRPDDRDALLEAIFGDEEFFFLGSDSAPHERYYKLCNNGCAGIFTAPVLLPILTKLFDDHDKLNKLPGFIANRAAAYYGKPNSGRTIRMTKNGYTIPSETAWLKKGNIVPFRPGLYTDWGLD